MNTESASTPLPRHDDLVDERLVSLYFVTALAYLFISMMGGFLMALQLVHMNPLRGIELMSPGRWRMIHTNAVAYGWLANAFLGALHWAVPRLTLRPVFHKGLSYLIYGAWQLVVLSTAVGILLGEAQGLEWGETPVWIDPVAQLGLLLVAINFMVFHRNFQLHNAFRSRLLHHQDLYLKVKPNYLQFGKDQGIHKVHLSQVLCNHLKSSSLLIH